MPDIAIDLKNISKSFKIYHENHDSLFDYLRFFNKNKNSESLDVLKNISFSVNRGEILGIVGLNGSGKSTLLKIISGILVPNSGEIVLNGKLTPLLELGVGFNPEMTAKDNIIMSGMLLGLTKKNIISKIDSIIEFAELETFSDTKLKYFSSGMYSRLGFSITIHTNPDILLIDETLSVGDGSFIIKCHDVFHKFKREKKTILLVSHSLEEMLVFCDSVIWIEDGIIKCRGKPKEILDKYSESMEISPGDYKLKKTIQKIFIQQLNRQPTFEEARHFFGGITTNAIPLDELGIHLEDQQKLNIQKIFLQHIHREPTLEESDYFFNSIKNNVMSVDELGDHLLVEYFEDLGTNFGERAKKKK